MSDAEFIRILIAFGSGALLATLGAWTNHLFSNRRWQSELRNQEVEYWREFADDWFNLAMGTSEHNTPVIARELPRNLNVLPHNELRRTEWIHELTERLGKGNRRAPEPLTEHVRLFLDRMRVASDTTPFDIELAKVAIVAFRRAMNDYVRRGKTPPVKVVPGESRDGYDGGAEEVRRRLGRWPRG